MQNLGQIAYALCSRRRQPARWLFVATAIPLAILALLAYEYGSSTEYAVCAAICLLQAIWPTLLGWMLVLSIFAGASLMYLVAAATASSADIGGDIALLILCLLFAVALFLARPGPTSHSIVKVNNPGI